MTTSDVQSLFDKFLSECTDKPIKVLPSSIANKHGQCFDLATEWTNRLGIPHYPNNPSPFPYDNAHQIYDNFGPYQAQYFDRIPNTPDFIPQKGDIVLWPAALNGGAGHVAIATGEGTTTWFKSFDENWDPANWYPKVIVHSYGYDDKEVLGVLRLKVNGLVITPIPMDNRPYFFDLIKNSDIPFDWGTGDSKKVTEGKVKEFVTWVKSQVTRAGQWDLICKDAGFTGDSNLVKHDYISGRLKVGCSPDELMKAKQDAQKQIVAAVQNVVLK